MMEIATAAGTSLHDAAGEVAAGSAEDEDQ